MKSAELIRSNKELILKMWIKRLKQDFPQVARYGKAAIQNDVPDLLDSLVENLENEEHQVDFSGKAHGKQRTNFKEYSLIHVIREYRLLKEVIFDVIDQTKMPDAAERDKIMFAVDKATEVAAETFFQHQKNKLVSANDKNKKNVKKLKDDEVSRQEFLRSLWHDLNNPLNNIKLSVELMENMEIPPSLSRLVKIVRSNTEKTSKMIRNLMDVNMVTAGMDLPVKREHCKLLEFLSELGSSYHLELDGRFRMILPENEITASLDRDALRRAIDNPISNAVKYGDDSMPIELKCLEGDAEVSISVTNYGKPIPVEQQSDIFKKFYRVSESRENGMGIGLHVVKGVAEAHGGTVNIESSEDSGTTFTIVLPKSGGD